MPVQSVTPVLNVSHVGQSFAWFEILGWQRGFSWNDCGMIGAGKDAKDSNEHGDADALHEIAVKNGMIVTYPPTDEPWGVREFHLRHPDGHMFRVSAGIQRES